MLFETIGTLKLNWAVGPVGSVYPSKSELDPQAGQPGLLISIDLLGCQLK